MILHHSARLLGTRDFKLISQTRELNVLFLLNNIMYTVTQEF